MDFVKNLLDEYLCQENDIDNDNEKVTICENKVNVHYEDLGFTSEEIHSEKNEQRTVQVILLRMF